MKDPANTVTVDLNLSQDRQNRYLAALRRRYNKATWGLPWLIARAVREVVAMEEEDPTLPVIYPEDLEGGEIND